MSRVASHVRVRRRRLLSIALASLVIGLPTLASADDVSLGDIFNTGCVVARSPANGCLVTNIQGPVAPGRPGAGFREGKACGWNVLMLFAWGDLRIETARRNGGLEEIHAVDTSVFSLVPGFYGITRYCTVVTGS